MPWVWNSVAFLVADVPFDNWPVYFGPQARFGAFAAGMTLAVVVAARKGEPGVPRRLARACCGCSALVVVACGAFLSDAATRGARWSSTTSPRSAGSC